MPPKPAIQLFLWARFLTPGMQHARERQAFVIQGANPVSSVILYP
jgi:hypothetical protein